MKKHTTTATKAADFISTLARLHTRGLESMSEITILLAVAYPNEATSRAGIQIKQTLQAANLTNDYMLIDANLYGYFDQDGVNISEAMQAQARAWLQRIAAKKDSPMGWREKTASNDPAAVLVWSNVHSEYDQRSGETTYVKPVFTVTSEATGTSFAYVIERGTVNIIG